MGYLANIDIKLDLGCHKILYCMKRVAKLSEWTTDILKYSLMLYGGEKEEEKWNW